MDDQDKIFDIADRITKHDFKEIWSIEGQNINASLNKEEVAEEMFFKGIAYILDHLHNLEEIDLDKLRDKIKEQT